MRTFITEKFLRDAYRVLEEVNNITNFTLSSTYKKAWLLRNDNPMIDKYKKDMGRIKFNKLIYYLKKKNYIRAENVKGRKAFIITKDGISKALKSSFTAENKNKRKDGKWIMVIFDIPKSHRKSRNLLHSILYNLGYKLLQHSVWVSPYNVLEKTEELFQLHLLDRYVKVFLIEKV